MKLSDILKEISIERNSSLERLLLAIPVGTYLCVHESTLDRDDDMNIFRFQEEFHVLRTKDECQTKVRKTQYGPKPDFLKGDAWPGRTTTQ